MLCEQLFWSDSSSEIRQFMTLKKSHICASNSCLQFSHFGAKLILSLMSLLSAHRLGRTP